MDKPELIIPVRFDAGNVPKTLEDVGKAGKKAGDDVEGGFHKARAGAESFNDSVSNLVNAQMSLPAVKAVAAVFGSEYSRAATYVQNMAKEFTVLRQAMRQVAALNGESNSNQFALSEVKAAAQARLTPKEWKRFQKQFQTYGGAYLEGDQARFVQRGEVSAKEQAEQYQAQIAEFAKARRINGEAAAQLGGGLLQFSEGPQKTEDLMSRYGKVFKTLERAPTPVAQLLPQLTRVMAQGASPEEAAQLLALMSEATPGEEETGVTNTIKAITNQVFEGKGEALGQKEGMSRLEQVKAAVTAIKERVGKGEKLHAVLHEVAPDLREMRGMKGFLTRGLEAGGFERVAGYVKETPADFVQTAIKDYEASDAGRQAKHDADEALARAERGAKNQDVEAQLQEARMRVTRSGALEQGRADFLVRDKLLGTISGVSAEEQVINEEADRTLRAQAIKTGIHGVGSREGDVAFRSQESVNAEIKDLLHQIAEATKKTAAAPPPAVPRPPLTAPPPKPSGRQ